MARMGDKVQAKVEMRAADVPVVPGTEGATTVEEVGAAAEEAGYPVLLKAVAGGGGKGMRLVRERDELESAYGTAALEAEAAFGDGSLYLEKAIAPARHVEIQVLADGEGGVLTLGERECSIQRRHQKLIEESPSPALTPEIREEMEAAAERPGRAPGHLRRGGDRGAAALRLAARQADRLGRVAAGGDRARAPGTRRAAARRRANHARARDRRPAERGLRHRPLLDRLPCGGGGSIAGARVLMAGGRRAARRTALVLLYQWDVTGRELTSLFEGEIDDYSRELAEAVVERREELDRRITE